MRDEAVFGASSPPPFVPTGNELHKMFMAAPVVSASGRVVDLGDGTVVKIVVWSDAFEKEVEHARIASEIGIGPSVYESGTIGEYGYIRCERLDGSLNDFLENRQESLYHDEDMDVDGAIRTPQARDWFSTLAKDLESIFHHMKTHQFLHLDLHSDNIFYKNVNDSVEWYLIDYGMAAHKPKFPIQIGDRDFQSEKHAWQNSLRWLRTQLNEFLYDENKAATPLKKAIEAIANVTRTPMRQPDLKSTAATRAASA